MRANLPEAEHGLSSSPTFRGRRGHPLLIPADLRPRLLSWPDSARLNRLFEEPDVTVRCLEGFDETILRDVDTPGRSGVSPR